MRRVIQKLQHAFKIEKEADFDPDEKDKELIDLVCREVVKRGMATPATLFLESTRPLNYIGSQTMVFFEPVMRTVLRHPEAWTRFSEILEHRGAIEYLCRTIESLENKRREDAPDDSQSDPE